MQEPIDEEVVHGLRVPVQNDAPPITVLGNFNNSREGLGQSPEILIPRNTPIINENPQKEEVVMIPSRSEERMTLVYYYRTGIGFVPSYTPVHRFPNEIIKSSLEKLSGIAYPYNQFEKEALIAIIGGLVGFFALGLFFFFLDLVADLNATGMTFGLLFMLGWLISIIVLVFLKWRRSYADGEQAISEFMNEENSKHYEQRGATLRAKLGVIEIDIQ